MLETLRGMASDRFHAVVTDPPYGLSAPLSGEDAAALLAAWLLEGEYHKPKGRKRAAAEGLAERVGPTLTSGFMNADWDACVPSPRQWAEVLRVLRPGGYALVFAGTRTAGWMAISLMLAGFEVLDQIDWLYGCLSEDTEILVDGRWVRFDEAREGRLALTFDPATGAYAWSPIQERFVYDYDDVAYRLESEHTDQLISRNHRCLVDRGCGWEFVRAEHLGDAEAVPVLTGSACNALMRGLREGTSALSLACQASEDAGLLVRVQRGTALPHDGAACSPRPELHADGTGGTASPHVGGKQPRMEGGSDLQAPARELRSGALRALPTGADLAPLNGASRRLHHGAPTGRGNGARENADALGVRASREPRPTGQSTGELDDLRNEPGSQALRGARLTGATLARVSPVHYRGRVWCVRVASGAFVARRNGKIFVTGNSGFPKGGDVSKRIDEAAGAERPVVGEREVAADRWTAVGRQAVEAGAPSYMLPVTAPATDEAAQWEDWSTTLKPAHEPIIVARKPLREKSVGANLLAWRAGALNIGACRVGAEGGTRKEPSDDKCNTTHTVGGYLNAKAGEPVEGLGRWPANIVLSHAPECGADFAACTPGCAAAALDEQGGERVSGSRVAGVRKGLGYQGAEGDGGPAIEGSSGGPSRFFYCAKASRADRECGLEDLPAEHDLRKKGHPTVKPTALMRWLVRLVCPPAWGGEAAGEVLDPFGGSGSTGVALALEGFRGVLVERDERYADVAQRRVAKAVAARTTGEVPKPWREKKPKPLKREDYARGSADGPTCEPGAPPDEEAELSPEEVAEARSVAEAATEILANPNAEPDTRAWAERHLRVHGLLIDEQPTYEEGASPAEAEVREDSALRPALLWRPAADGIEVLCPAPPHAAEVDALLTTVEARPTAAGWLVPDAALEAADAALSGAGWTTAAEPLAEAA